jgi:surfeit locus 1 family protein
MSRRTIVFCVFAALAAILFVRLGFWQLARLHAKVQRNVTIAAQQRVSPVQFASLPADTAVAHYRRASLTGVFDYEHELVLSARTYQGSPGAELLTPMRVAGSDTVVPVNRGWVYSPDGASVDRARWREGDSVTVVGYVEQYAPDAASTPSTRDPRIVRRVTHRDVSTRIPYPLARYYLVQTGDTASSHPVRREMPVLDEGPHLGYAIQWFAFALIAIGGALALVWRDRRSP